MRDLVDYFNELRKRTVLFLTSTLFAAGATMWGLAGGPPLGWLPVLLIAGALFVWAGFGAWRDQHVELQRTTERGQVATAFKETWESANQMFAKGTAGCHSGTEADVWIREYDDEWLPAAKKRIETAAGPEECTAVFGIGPMLDLTHVNGHNVDHTKRLTCLKHHMEQLKDGLKRYLPSSRSFVG